MNYIRTKDGIIDLTRIHLDGSPIYNLDTKENVIKANENKEERDCYYIENDTIYGYWYLDGCIWDCHIINQADTIEELCDEFVIKHIQGEKPYLPDNFKKELIAVDKQDIFKYGVKNLYGAIWTDKGLIYVAKMNEKGELELL